MNLNLQSVVTTTSNNLVSIPIRDLMNLNQKQLQRLNVITHVSIPIRDLMNLNPALSEAA